MIGIVREGERTANSYIQGIIPFMSIQGARINALRQQIETKP
jgi:hypothetical protein